MGRFNQVLFAEDGLPYQEIGFKLKTFYRRTRDGPPYQGLNVEYCSGFSLG